MPRQWSISGLGSVELALPKIPHSKSPMTGFWMVKVGSCSVSNTLRSFRSSQIQVSWGSPRSHHPRGSVGTTGAAGACEEPGVLWVALWYWWRLSCPSRALGTSAARAHRTVWRGGSPQSVGHWYPKSPVPSVGGGQRCPSGQRGPGGQRGPDPERPLR